MDIIAKDDEQQPKSKETENRRARKDLNKHEKAKTVKKMEYYKSNKNKVKREGKIKLKRTIK